MRRSLFVTILLLFSSSIQADVAIWVTSTTHDGMFGADAAAARVAADASCSSDPNKPATHDNVHAYMSFSATDAIVQMNSNYAMPTNERFVRSDLTTQVAADFNAMLNTNSVDLDASISSPPLLEIWTFSGNDGSFDTTDNCLNGTSGAPATGTGGLSNYINNYYLDEGGFSCDRAHNLYCVSWRAAPVAVTKVPTLSVWGLLLLTTIMGLVGIKTRNRKQP